MKIENVGFPVREPMLMQGKVDAITSFAYSSVVALRSNGVAPEDITVMYMRDYGLELYGNTLLASPKLMQENPEAIRKFVRATIRGYFDAANDPAYAIATVTKRNPVTTEAAERMRLGLFLNDNYFTKEVKANGVGHVDTARMTRAIDQIGETSSSATSRRSPTSTPTPSCRRRRSAWCRTRSPPRPSERPTRPPRRACRPPERTPRRGHVPTIRAAAPKTGHATVTTGTKRGDRVLVPTR